MRVCHKGLTLPMLLTALVACSSASAQVGQSPRRDRDDRSAQSVRAIEGTVSWRDRTALPANAVLEITLEEVTRSGAQQGLVIARMRNEQPGDAPIPFTLAFDTDRIRSNSRYVVRASLFADGRLWYATRESYPVLARRRDNIVDMVLRPVSSNADQPVVQNATLENTYWRLIGIGNVPIRATSNQREANIVLRSADHRVTGSGGCNQISGTYKTISNVIGFSDIISTKMACSDGMQTEQQFLQALGRVRHWKVTGQRLDLLDSSNRNVASFEAAPMR